MAQSGAEKTQGGAPGVDTGCSLRLGRGGGGERPGSGSHTAGPGGKLKNWKYEKLTVCTPDQHVWIPDFQNFRFSPSTATPEILPMGLNGERGIPESARSRFFRVCLYKHSHNGELIV